MSIVLYIKCGRWCEAAKFIPGGGGRDNVWVCGGGGGEGVGERGWGGGGRCKWVEVGVGGGDPRGLISLDHSPVVHPSAFRE